MKIVAGWAYPDADEFMVSEMAKTGTYQKSHLKMALEYVKEPVVAIDGGAHIGSWSKIMSGLFGRVIAFEPTLETAEALLHNMQTFDCSNVEVNRKALGRKPGRVRMGLDGFYRAIALKNTGAMFVHPGDEVDVITIDSLELERLDFLKLDVEGSEVDALMGSAETLARCRPVVLFEDKNLWGRYGHSRRAPHEFLQSLGARHLDRAQMDEIWGW